MRAFRNERERILIPWAVVGATITVVASLVLLYLGVSFAKVTKIASWLIGGVLLVVFVFNFLLKRHQLKYGGD
ncbi:hypothetical protein ACFL15_00160 [Patescibacteria group bacterium]